MISNSWGGPVQSTPASSAPAATASPVTLWPHLGVYHWKLPTTITSLKSQIPLLEHNGYYCLDSHSLTNRNPLFNFFQNLGTFDSSTISEFLASFWPHFLPPAPAWTPHKPLSLLLLSYLAPLSSHQTPIPPSVWIFCCVRLCNPNCADWPLYKLVKSILSWALNLAQQSSEGPWSASSLILLGSSWQPSSVFSSSLPSPHSASPAADPTFPSGQTGHMAPSFTLPTHYISWVCPHHPHFLPTLQGKLSLCSEFKQPCDHLIPSCLTLPQP